MKPADNTEVNPSLCWHCHAELDSPYKCDRCVKIQPWSDGTDRFSFLGLPRRLGIDLVELDDRFLKLSRIFHPDFFQDSFDDEREISLVNAARLNTAYNTLKDPTTRAGYLLELELGAKYHPTKIVPPELAEQIMELQELLTEYTAATTEDSPDPQREAEVVGEQTATEKRLATNLTLLDELFAAYDRVMDEATSPFEPETRRKKQEILKRLDETLAARLYLQRAQTNINAALAGNHVNVL